MRRPFLVGISVCLLVVPATLVLGKGGGGGHGGGPGGGPGNQNNESNPQKQAEQTQKKVDDYVADGFAALKAFDTAAALEDFAHVIQLQPEDALARIGLGLSRAQKGKFAASETEFSAAISCARKAKENPDIFAVAKPADPSDFFTNPATVAKPDLKAAVLAEAESNLRLATFDLAVAYSRDTAKPRSLVLIDRLITESKPPDEMLVNAQRSLLATMDEKAQSAIAALPAMLKSLETTDNSLRTVHMPLRRWGVMWMDSNEVTRHRMNREPEPLPQKLPFLLPDDEVLPEGKKPDAPLTNPLQPIVMGPGSTTAPAGAAGPAAAATQPGVASAGGAATPATTPAAVAANPAPGNPVAANAAPASPASAIPAAPAAPATQPARSTARTVTGAACAVAPDMLLTCSRLVAGAKTIQVQSIDGASYRATLVATDDALGLSLLKVDGSRFLPLVMAPAPRPGAVNVAGFTKPGVFGPELEILHGELALLTGQWTLRTGAHPRSAGSPLLNDKGQIVAILIATRDDALAKLPVVPVDAIRKFVEGKVPPASGPAGPAQQQSVLEVSATREDQ